MNGKEGFSRAAAFLAVAVIALSFLSVDCLADGPDVPEGQGRIIVVNRDVMPDKNDTSTATDVSDVATPLDEPVTQSKTVPVKKPAESVPAQEEEQNGPETPEAEVDEATPSDAETATAKPSDAAEPEEGHTDDGSEAEATATDATATDATATDAGTDVPGNGKGTVIAIACAAAAVLVAGGAVLAFTMGGKGRNVPPGGPDGFDSVNAPALGIRKMPIGNVWENHSSIIGTRDYQQDSVATAETIGMSEQNILDMGYAASMCDGMGGLEGGEKASRIAADMMVGSVYSGTSGPAEAMRKAAEDADIKVYSLKNSMGKRLKSGTTMTAAYIRNGELYYANVGDSRIYLYRDGRLHQISEDHNFFTQLTRGETPGSAKWEEALRNEKKDALTSYVGMGGIKHIYCPDQPLKLKSGDIAVLCSDGLYRALREDEMAEIIGMYKDRIDLLPHILTAAAFDKDKPNQDNTSAVTLKYL